MEKLIPEELSISEIEIGYQNKCEAPWLLHSSKKQKGLFFYWY
jgi:hypothetical protein